MKPETTGHKKSSLENAKFAVDILSGLAVPVVLAIITIHLGNQHDKDIAAQTKREDLDRQALASREHDDRNAQLILGIGPYLFDGDIHKVQFGTSVLAYYKDLPAPLVKQLQSLNDSTDPAIAESAGRALAGRLSSIQSGASTTIEAPAVAPDAPSNPRDHWMVYIASGANADALYKFAERANATFRLRNLPLTAKVVGPGPLAPLMSGVVVGDNVPFDQARANRDLARNAGFLDTFIIRVPGERTP